MKKLNLDKIIYILILVIMIGIPVFKFLMYVPVINNINPYHVRRLRVYFFWISIAGTLLVYLFSVISKERKITYIDILVYFLIFSLFVSSSNAINFMKSIFGENARYEGFLTLVNYYLVLLNAKNIKEEKYKNGLLKCFITLGIIQSFYAIYQSLTPYTFLNNKFSEGAHMAMGLCGNPNFFGAYMAMQLSIPTVLFIKEGKKKNLLIFILFSIALYLASSTGPMIGFVLAFILIGIMNFKNYKRVLFLLVVFLLVSFGTDKAIRFTHKANLKNYSPETYVISNDIADTAVKIENKEIEAIGNGRIGLWKRSLPLVKKYWLTGCGLDNFRNALPRDGTKQVYDKAHNVYLQMAITNGVIPTLVYMFICLIVFLKGFKLKNKESCALFMAFVSYCILAFANISVIDVAPYFFIILGLLISETESIKLFHRNKTLKIIGDVVKK